MGSLRQILQASRLPLLGGRCWNSVRIYNTCYDDLFDFNTQPIELARDLYVSGIRAMKILPFDAFARRNRGQSISTEEREEGLAPVRQIREALRSEMEIAVEFHGFWNLPCVTEIAKAL